MYVPVSGRRELRAGLAGTMSHASARESYEIPAGCLASAAIYCLAGAHALTDVALAVCFIA